MGAQRPSVGTRLHTAGDDLTTMGAGGGNVIIEHGTGPNEQLYVQATFPYLNAYLGVVMHYNAATYRQEVHLSTVYTTVTTNTTTVGFEFVDNEM